MNGKMRVERRNAFRSALALLAALGAIPAYSQTYPARPVRVMLPYPPGGPTDVLVRIVAAKLSESLGQSFTVDRI